MNTIAANRIKNLQEKAFNRLVAFIEAGVPSSAKFLAIKALSRISTGMAREKVLEQFEKVPDEEQVISCIGDLQTENAGILLATRVKDPKARNRDLLTEQLGTYATSYVFEMLLELLEDKDRHVRFQAAQALFRTGGKDAALALARHIADPDEWISMTILRLLCLLKEHATIPLLLEHFSKEKDIRRKAIMVSSLSMFRSITLIPIFDEGLHSNDQRLKANSIEAIGELTLPPREIESRLQPFLNDPNNRIRANAILALTKTDPEATADRIREMGDSQDFSLRRSAAYVIGMVPSERFEDLALRLLVDPADEVRRRMVLSLKKYRPEFQRAQVEKLITDPNRWIRKFSTDMAAEYPDFPKAPFFKHLRTETAYPNLVSSFRFFVRHPDPEVKRYVKQRIRDPREPVVSAALEALASVEGLRGLKEIFPLLDTQDPIILKKYAVLHVSHGGIELIDTLIEKGTGPKRLPHAILNLPALADCLNLLKDGETIPAGLHEVLSREEVVERPPEKPAEMPSEKPEEKGPVLGLPSGMPDLSDLFAPAAAAVPPAGEAGLPPLVASGEEGSRDEEGEKEVPDGTSKLFSKALRLFNMGKMSKARETLLKCLEENPGLKKCHYYLGRIALEEKEYDQARESLLLYLEQHPSDLKANLALARVYKSLRNWAQIITIYSQIQDHLGETPAKVQDRLRRDYGVALYFSKEFARSREVLEKVSQDGLKDPETGFYLAMGFFHEKQFQKAEHWLLEVLRGAPQKSQFRTMAENSLVRIRELQKG